MKYISVNVRLACIYDDRYSSIIFVRCAPQHAITEVKYLFRVDVFVSCWLIQIWMVTTLMKIPYRCKVYEQNKTIGKRFKKIFTEDFWIECVY
jgi:hypothetical protein